MKMTKLSVNVNKVALLRNARGRDFPNVEGFANRCLDEGADGITLHPRPDQRHATYADVYALSEICKSRSVELNVEGYPDKKLLEVIERTRPAQYTLVPDSPDQLTSDHGWNFETHSHLLRDVIGFVKELGVRTSLFVDFLTCDVGLVAELGADRVELFTGPFVDAIGSSREQDTFDAFRQTALRAQLANLGVNAGHDLSLRSLPYLLKDSKIMEISVGHALVAESVERGIGDTIQSYLRIIKASMGNAV